MKNLKIGEFVDFAFAALFTAAVLTFLMITGCSTDNENTISKVESTPGIPMGGSAEETSAQASLGNFTFAGKIGNVFPRVMNLADESGNVFSSPSGRNVVFAKGTMITVFELDSASLDTTGQYFVGTLSDSSGSFSFEDLSLNSPYVLISVQDSCKSENCIEKGMDYFRQYYYVDVAPDAKYSRTLSAIVDLRKTKNISVNILTHFKAPVLRKNVAEGLSFDEANTLAEKSVLEWFGVYENLGAFEEADNNVDSDLAYVGQIALEYGKAGGRAWLNDEFVLQNLIDQYWFASPDVFPKLGKEMESLYKNTMKMIEYKTAYLAHYLKKGQCTEEREGEMFYDENMSYYNTFAYVCRSGKWVPGYKKVEHVKGTLVDSRDGKTYKTVTYNIGGVSYTWMAEDLDYTGKVSATGDSLKADLADRSICSYKEEKSSEWSSREYKWEAAANVNIDSVKILLVNSKGDTVIMPEFCTNALRIMSDSIAAENPIFCNLEDGFDCLPNLWGAAVGQGPCDSIMDANGGLDAASWNYTELLPEYDPSSFQGICPDGFRLPNVKDWATLIGYMEEQYDIDSSKVGRVLLDEYATGFGMKNELRAFDVEDMWTFVSPIRDYIGVPNFELKPVTELSDTRPGIITRISGMQISESSLIYMTASDYNYVFDPYIVRCVKTE